MSAITIPTTWRIIKLSKPTGTGPAPGKRPLGKDWPNQPGLSPDEITQALSGGYNIGVLTGERSGRLLVLDYDGDVPQDMPRTPRVFTGGGGIHDYYHVPDGIDLGKANRVKFEFRGCKIDARWTGGQAVFPPSVHAETGAVYEWAPGLSPDDVPLADVPEDAIAAIRGERCDDIAREITNGMNAFLQTALDGACNDIRCAPVGQRNDTLNKKAYHLGGYPFPCWRTVAQSLLCAALDVGLSDTESKASIQSGLRAGRNTPRAIPDRAPAPALRVTAAPAPVLSGPPPFRVLGHCNGRYYFLPAAGGQVVDLTPLSLGSLSNLLTLAPLEYWELHYPGEKTGVKVPWAADTLISECHAAGLFDPRNIRGRGAWHDAGRIILHRGSELIIDGRPTALTAIESRFVYQKEHDIEIPYDAPLSQVDAERGVLALCNSLAWENTQNGNLLAGWLALAPICGVLAWRPHIWITGSKGTGKSYVQDHIVPMLGRTCVRVQGCSTEAGIRQLLRSDAFSVAFDEAESDGEKAAANIQRVLELARQASSSDGGVIAKGTAAGTAQTFDIRSMFSVSSIAVSVQRSADASRVTVMTLNKPPSGTAGVNAFRAIQTETATWCQGEAARAFVARSVRMAPVIRENCRRFVEALAATRTTRRNADQLGTLLGGWWSLRSDAPPTDEDVRWIVQEYDIDAVLPDESTSDEMQFIEYLMGSVVRCELRDVQNKSYNTTRSIRELIIGSIENENGASRALQRYGMRCMESGEGLFIASANTELARILRGTQWAHDWNRFTRRLNGVTHHAIARVQKAPARGVVLPYSVIFT